MQHDSFFFIGIFIFIFLLWIFLGGPSRPLSLGGPLLPAPDKIGGGTYLTFPRASGGGGGSDGSGVVRTPTRSNPDTLSREDQKAVEEAREIARLGVPSPYRGTIRLTHNVTGEGSANPQQEYVQFELSNKATAPVTISGWQLASEVSGKQAVIPQGTEVPRSGIINASWPITLNPGDRAIVSSGRSPIGASFRENVCIGYFAQFQTFTPALPLSCPLPEQELEAKYGADLVRDPVCRDYVDGLKRCTLSSSVPSSLTSACQSFITNYLNYNGCLTSHERDTNFKGKTWRIYLGRDVSMWRKNSEVLKLLDTTGKTIDTFSY